MTLRPISIFNLWLLVLVGLFVHTAPVWAQQPPLALQPPLSPDYHCRLAEAAQNPTLAPWQREFMLELARGKSRARVAGPLSAQHGGGRHPAGIAAGDGTWFGTPAIVARYGHSAIYDPMRDRMLVFGGLDGIGHHNDVWALSLAGSPAWSVLVPAGAPPSARADQTVIYDPVRDRMLVFGGWDRSANFNDVWALSLGASPGWSPLSPDGTPPSARHYHTAIYDPVRDRMLVFGGAADVVDPSHSYLNDAWELTLAGSPAWSALAPAGTPPSARYLHTVTYDPVRDRMLVFGGWDGGPRNDVSALSLAGGPAWSELAPAGAPPGLIRHTAIYDPVRDRLLVFGGDDGLAGTAFNSAWALSLAGSPTWSPLNSAGNPPFRSLHTAIYDPVRDRMLVFGGHDFAQLYNDLWVLSLAGSPAWGALAPAGTAPSGRWGHTSIYDPARDRMLVFGGSHFFTFNDVWALWLAGIPAWSALSTTGTPPPRVYHTAIYDPVRDRMLVFGGFDAVGYQNDVWALSLAGSPTWSTLATDGAPPPARGGHTAIYDPVRDRMLVFGGYDGLGYQNDVWALSLGGSPAWSALAPSGDPPSARYQPTAIYDPVGDRMVVFGGVDDVVFSNDVWALSLAGSPAWSVLAPSGDPPSGRYQHTAIYDPERDRMIVFGGYDGLGYQNEVWALSLAGSPAWSALAPSGNPPSARYQHTAIYDSVRGRMLMFGGSGFYVFNDLWALKWGTPVSVPDGNARVSRFALAAPRPNPSFGPAVTLDFTLPQATPVSLVIFDVAGRMVRKLVDGPLPAGRHSTVWDRRDQRGRAVSSGVYLVRFVAPGVQLISKSVIAHDGSRG